MINWKTERLGNLVKFSSGGTPNKMRQEYWNGNIPWISAKTMKSERISTSELFITQEGLDHGSKLAPIGSLLLLTRGSGLFNGIPICYVEKPVAYNQDIKCIESVSEIEIEFIYYWLKAQSDTLQKQLDVTGIGAGKFDTKFLQNLLVLYPDALTRKKIIAFANNITEKIYTNNAINENLLQQVTAYYHHCFDRYEESRVTVRQLGEVACFKYGTMPKKDKLGSGEYVAFSGYQVVGAYPEKMYSDPQLIIVARGVGGCGDIKYTPSNCFLTNLSIAIQTEQIAIEDYLYHYLRLHDTKTMNTGSAQPQITVSTLEKYQLPIPEETLLESFSAFTQPFKNLYRKNREENERLALIRDMLLPQLMSGELDISELAL